MTDAYPFVSCLCVTENRRPFWDWMVAGYVGQTYPKDRRELVVVAPAGEIDDLLRHPSLADERVRGVVADAGVPVPAKRNMAMAAVGTTWLWCWWDDDDYFVRDRLRLAVERLGAGTAYLPMKVGLRYLYLPWLTAGLLEPCNGHGFGIHRGVLEWFDTGIRQSSDADWMSRTILHDGVSGAEEQGRELDLGFCLSHRYNVTQVCELWNRPVGKPRPPVRPPYIPEDEWAEVVVRLRALVERLEGSP